MGNPRTISEPRSLGPMRAFCPSCVTLSRETRERIGYQRPTSSFRRRSDSESGWRSPPHVWPIASAPETRRGNPSSAVCPMPRGPHPVSEMCSLGFCPSLSSRVWAGPSGAHLYPPGCTCHFLLRWVRAPSTAGQRGMETRLPRRSCPVQRPAVTVTERLAPPSDLPGLAVPALGSLWTTHWPAARASASSTT